MQRVLSGLQAPLEPLARKELLEMSDQQVLWALQALQGLKAQRVQQVLQDLRERRDTQSLTEQ